MEETSTSPAIRATSIEILERLGFSAEDLKQVQGAEVILCGDASGYLQDPNFYLHSIHPTREAALGSISYDGVNPLPTLLVRPAEGVFETIDYEPVQGMSTDVALTLGQPPIDPEFGREGQFQGFVEEILTYLGHFDD